MPAPPLTAAASAARGAAQAPPTNSPRLVILGAGPTGLGAVTRLQEAGHTSWNLIEQAPHAGGLAASVVDEQGFTWDLGGHVQFSHYPYFDRMMDRLLGPDGWLHHERESWVWLRGGFVPYPFQLNLHRLPRAEMKACVAGLVRLYKQAAAGQSGGRPRNFGEWIDATFGAGIAEVFMRPYNFKVWAYPPEEMSFEWIGERVAVTDLERVLDNIFEQRDELSWGPNNTFRFPRHGGTGAVWRAAAAALPAGQQHYGARVVRIDTAARLVYTQPATAGAAPLEPIAYDRLLSTLPLDRLTALLHPAAEHAHAAQRAAQLRYSSTHIFGIGLAGAPPPHLRKKCWMYFPEADCPFYRVTVFSNYSPNNVPDISRHWSLMAEVSESPAKPVPATPAERLEQVIAGMLATGLIERRADIISTWQTRLEHGYPTPHLGRDEIVWEVLPALEQHGISSRGRFGAWRYEVANQDHSLMQGVEWADRVLHGAEETTLFHPEVVNDMRRPGLRAGAAAAGATPSPT